jgi:galactose mutarotase-like enzyme
VGDERHSIRRGADPELPELERITLASAAGVEAAFLPGSGMLGTSLALDGAELLFRRGGLEPGRTRGWSSGIPLLAPWANRLGSTEQSAAGVEWRVVAGENGAIPDDNGHPIHGLLSLAPFEVDEAVADDAGALLRARAAFGPELASFPSFPFPHDLEVVVELRERVLRLTTSLTPTTAQAVPVAFGWHPWFALPDVPRAEWVLTTGLRRQALLDDENVPTGEVVDRAFPSGPLGDAFMDDVWVDAAAGSEAVLEGGGRRIAVRWMEGYDVAVVFAPTVMDTVCLEPMTAPTDPFRGWWPLRLAEPGETVSGVFEIEVGPSA